MPPMAAAVAMMMVIEMMSEMIAPPMASTRW